MSTEFDLVVIGAGPGGYIAALRAAQMGARTAIVEKEHVGGTCLNRGCIPSKALLAPAALLHRMRTAQSLGLTVEGTVSFDWPTIQKNKNNVVRKLRDGTRGLLEARGVTLFSGAARFASPTTVVVRNDGESEEITGKQIIIATGSLPARIPGWPTDPHWVCTTDEALEWTELPRRLGIIGGGVVGVEFACMMQAYGVQVTILEMLPHLLPELESSLGIGLTKELVRRGIDVRTATRVESIDVVDEALAISTGRGDSFTVDKVLTATGRQPNTNDLGLAAAGLETEHGFVSVNQEMATSVDGISCIGDANGRCLLAHAASAQAIVAVNNALGRTTTYSQPIPSAVYTFPEIASVGLTTQQAAAQQLPVRIGTFPLSILGKALAVNEPRGFVNVLHHREDATLLGVHIFGAHATEIISSATALLSTTARATDLAEMVFAHPTFGEAVKEAAEDSFGQALHLPPRRMLRLRAETEEVAAP